MREGDIITATPTSKGEKVPLQTNFIDETLDINMESELNNVPMEVIHETMKTIPGEKYTACQITLLLVMLARMNLTF